MADKKDKQDENDQQPKGENDQNDDAGTPGNGPAGDDNGALEDSGKPAGDSATDSTDWKAEAEKWKRLSRKNEGDLKSTAAKLKQYEDASKSDAQRLEEDRDSHRSRAEKAESALKLREIAEECAPDHATVAQVKKVAKRLRGDTEEELIEDAKELWADFAPAAPKTQMPAKPKEKLRGGGDPDDEPGELDPRKLAARIPRAR